MRVFNDFNETKAAVGTEVGVSDWIEITQERINKFAEATGDEQWIHVDTERAARESPGRTTIAHGLPRPRWLTSARASHRYEGRGRAA